MAGFPLQVALATAIAAACAGPAFSEEKPLGRQGGAAADERQVEDLIGHLASPNPEPDCRRDRINPELPKGFDKNAQYRVHAALAELHNRGLRVWPYLIEAAKRPENLRRYSYTTSSAVWYNVPVADACTSLIEGEVAIGPQYKFRTGAGGLGHGPPNFFREVMCAGAFDRAQMLGNLEKWWQANRRRTLRSVQLESLRWALAQERRTGVPADPTRSPGVLDLNTLVHGYERALRDREAATDENAPYPRLVAGRGTFYLCFFAGPGADEAAARGEDPLSPSNAQGDEPAGRR